MYSPQKKAALTRSRLTRNEAERRASFYYCTRHPGEVRDEAAHCESCIRDGYELRVRSVRIGNKSHLVITVPATPERAE